MTASRKIARVILAVATVTALASPMIANAAMYHHKAASSAQNSNAPKQ
ncbi:MAG: hypothetical protein KGJ03_11490 [Betaproteobacteria bacterium]|nr:hypothetical protein [Thiomonas sp. FB-6]MBU6439830.1 hypothetical protein [Betaproteobacteria bacterium]MBU6511943.1 hypothetical protein [Betaproteobacteria bacterium]MDE1956335.1 hypothetical protein [Betaproteobacteria bacterium]MDE2152173.1 hypothetical protein [Betaproteobacteria bacterium]MDE2477259.1 hypothetical protein [Betaproteobacteria bacterium]